MIFGDHHYQQYVEIDVETEIKEDDDIVLCLSLSFYNKYHL